MHLASRGIPRLVNQICDYALVYAFTDGLEKVDAERDRAGGHRPAHARQPQDGGGLGSPGRNGTHGQSRRQVLLGGVQAAPALLHGDPDAARGDGITVAYILPPVYQSSASLLAEPQQIPGQLESSAEINPFEQIQIVEQRVMTRANLYVLGQRIGLYADQPDLSVGEIIGDMRDRIEFIGFEPDPTVRPGTPGAIIVGVSSAPTPARSPPRARTSSCR